MTNAQSLPLPDGDTIAALWSQAITARPDNVTEQAAFAKLILERAEQTYEARSWRPATLPPSRTTADRTGWTVGLALYLPTPKDGGPTVRPGYFDHAVCRYIDGLSGQTVEPLLWSMPGAA